MTTDIPKTKYPESRAGFIAGLFCYAIWGFVPLAIQAMGGAGAGSWEILAHRIVWGAASAFLMVLAAKQGRQVIRVLSEPKTLALLFLSSAFIAINWIVFIHAVNDHRMLETSLGYYINPLVNMAAGALLFREKLNRIALAAIALAAIGVAVQVQALGHLPWISLALAFSFGAYGIVRKQVAADAQTGLFVECLLLGVPSLFYILWLEQSGAGVFLTGAGPFLWLIAAGPITATPLALFAWAARRIPLSAMGFMQFIAPTIGFVTAILQGETFTRSHAASFTFIWLGAAVFIYGAIRSSRKAAPVVVEAVS